MPIVFALHKSWVSRYWPRILTAGVLAGLCWVLAVWTWIMIAPQPVAAVRPADPPVDLADAREAILRSRIFGSSAPAGEAHASAPPSLNLKLVGITASASRGAASRAVLNIGGKGNEVFHEGKEIAPGIVLNRILKDHVLIRRQGVTERIGFPDAPVYAVGQAPAQGFNLSVQQQGRGHYSFSGSTLTRSLQDPVQLAQLGAFTVTPGTGVIVNQAPPGSLAEKLSLQAGDAIRSVNGETVNSADDLARLYQKFTSSGQVKLEGTRAGAPLALTLTIKP